MNRIMHGLVLLALLPFAVNAQRAQTRQGFGISFGVGTGSAGLACDGCTFDRESGLSGYLRIGGYVSPSLMVAGESNSWSKNVDGVDETVSFLSAVVQWYPNVSSGLYLKGGAGIAVGGAQDDFDEISASGMGITLGLGYDWRLTKSFSLTPYVNYLRSVGAEAKLNGVGVGGDLTMDLLQLGLGFTWH